MTKINCIKPLIPAAKDGIPGAAGEVYFIKSGALSIHVKDNVSTDPRFEITCWRKVGAKNPVGVSLDVIIKVHRRKRQILGPLFILILMD